MDPDATSPATELPWADDDGFARALPEWARRGSGHLWTPLSVARLAVRWLAARAGARVLDVGAGAGKLCVVGALLTRGHFTGVERNPALHALALALAARTGATGTTWLAGDALALAWDGYDALYFFNPFYDLVADAGAGSGGEQSAERALEKLAELRAGTRVVTYCGLGAPLPPSWVLHAREPGPLGPLELYVQSRP